MNSQFINRLVGTVIVVVAAIVFIPNILDGEKAKKSESFKAIPDRPEFKAIDLDPAPNKLLEQESLPSIPVVEESAVDARSDSPFDTELPADTDTSQTAKNSDDTQSVEATVSVNTLAKTQPITDIDNSLASKRPATSNLNDYAWVIQLGAFSHKENLQALLDKLKKAEFTAFTKPIKTPTGSLTKVFVGPELDKKRLESQLPKLKKLTKLEGRVTQFEITN